MQSNARFVALMLLAGLTTLLTSAILLRNTQRAVGLVEHTKQVQVELANFQSFMLDSEVGQRGFIITGNEDYLQPFIAAEREAMPRLEQLIKLTQDNPPQAARLKTLQPLLTERLSVIQTTIDAMRSNDRDRAVAIVRSGRGKAVTDQMRTIVADAQKEEDRLIGERDRRATALQRALWGILAASFAGFLTTIELIRRQRATFVANLEQQISDRTEHLSIVTQELTHRTKNLLAMVSGLSRQTKRSSASLDEFAIKFDQRLQSLASSVSQLSNTNWLSADLEQVIRSQLLLLDNQMVTDRIRVDGDAVAMNATATHYVGLAIHELLTNAIKHGALSTDGGRVAITWRRVANDLHFTWREDGAATAVSEGDRRGFGSELLDRMVPRLLSGSSERRFAPGGLEWRLVAPITAIMAQNAEAAAGEVEQSRIAS